MSTETLTVILGLVGTVMLAICLADILLVQTKQNKQNSQEDKIEGDDNGQSK